MRKATPKRRNAKTARTVRLRAELNNMRAKIRPLCTTSQVELYDVYCFLRGMQIGLKLGKLEDDDSLGTTIVAAGMVRDAIKSLKEIEEATSLASWE
jgi:hypothetical protein